MGAIKGNVEYRTVKALLSQVGFLISGLPEGLNREGAYKRGGLINKIK